MEINKIYCGDCLETIKTFPDNSIDSIVTDPPYHLVSIVKRFGKEDSAPANFGKDGAFSRVSKGFMGKTWDGLGEDGIGIANNVDLWRECLRVLKPGGHLLSFSGTRTYHRMASAIEDAGFEVRDMIEWCYGSGFPKSLNIGKAVDKLQGNEREIIGENKNVKGRNLRDIETLNVGAGAGNNTELTKGTSEREGRGTSLKPAHEPICLARKPLAEKTVAENCLKWGTGGINIDESRVETNGEKLDVGGRGKHNRGEGYGFKPMEDFKIPEGQGRFPANLIHDNSEEVRECFPETGKGNGKDSYNYAGREYNNKDTSMFNGDKPQAPSNFNDSGNASRFFKSILYYPKASKSERNKGTQDYLVFNITLGGENMELDELQQNDMLEKIRKWCIDWFGKKGIDQSKIDFKYTIKIETKKITILVILNFLVHLNTKEYTVDAIETKNENDENLVENVENTSPLKQIITKELTEYLHDVSNVVFKMPVKINVSGNQNNFHSTVKPIALMEYLIKMVTKEGGIVLDPFAGSGTTLVAAKKNGYQYIGCELTEEYIPIIEARLNATEEEVID